MALTTTPFEALAAEVDAATQATLALPDVAARDTAMRLKHAIEEFHQHALIRLVQRLKADAHGQALLLGLLDEPSLYALFAMHGLIKLDTRARVIQALETVRPYLHGHGGDVELVDIRDTTIHLRLHGACQNCGASSETLRNAVEVALRAQAPEITAIEVLPPVTGLVPLDAIAIR